MTRSTITIETKAVVPPSPYRPGMRVDPKTVIVTGVTIAEDGDEA